MGVWVYPMILLLQLLALEIRLMINNNRKDWDDFPRNFLL